MEEKTLEQLTDEIFKNYKPQLVEIQNNATAIDPAIWMCQIDSQINELAMDLQAWEGYDDYDLETLGTAINEALCSL